MSHSSCQAGAFEWSPSTRMTVGRVRSGQQAAVSVPLSKSPAGVVSSFDTVNRCATLLVGSLRTLVKIGKVRWRSNHIGCFISQLPGRKERKHWALRPQKPLRLIRDGEVGGSGILYLTPTRYAVTTRMILH